MWTQRYSQMDRSDPAVLSPRGRAAEMSLSCWSPAKHQKHFSCRAVQQNWQCEVRGGQRWMRMAQDLKPTWSCWIPPKGSREKLPLLILVHLVLFFSFFPSKSAFYSKAELQKLEVMIRNSSAPLLPGLISLFIVISWAPVSSKGPKALSGFNFLTQTLPFQNYKKQLGF